MARCGRRNGALATSDGTEVVSSLTIAATRGHGCRHVATVAASIVRPNWRTVNGHGGQTGAFGTVVVTLRTRYPQRSVDGFADCNLARAALRNSVHLRVHSTIVRFMRLNQRLMVLALFAGAMAAACAEKVSMPITENFVMTRRSGHIA